MNTPIPADVTAELLRQMWQTLNRARAELKLPLYSYKFLTQIAASSKAIPGEPIDVSRATIYSVMQGTYASATAPAIRRRLVECINVKIQDLLTVYPNVSIQGGSGVPPLKTKPRKRRTPIIIHRRCSQQGYITWRGNTYYLGSAFGGDICTVSPLRDRAHGIRVTTAHASRDAHPIDASTNQLGYEVLN